MLPLRASLRQSASILRYMRGISPMVARSAPISSSIVNRRPKEYIAYDLESYPKVERISAQRLPPTGYWDEQDRRDKETPLHEDDDLLTMWMVDEVYQQDRYTVWQALGQLVLMLSLLGGVFAYAWWLNVPVTQRHAVPKRYPDLYLELGGDPKKLQEQKKEQ
ncbi:hypothetical protein TrispH2_008007 [Trichoplax sp. H2]|uniref:NADH dehydrogenase [ubiquinone] 1 beta subcomplex subunit 8, mitochondrial n=1 Tax=Trichoplax adhaerens TaxID=10228 RepID=B3RRM7_TRIAD|nr:expressed hypothetical protein [Trichoplax adhaerens]EDV26896.1 expressed hypothetical protein [Trichoplax adhaerens]RDD39680.1 hypothetical protein TrispH2_008007 [Trichoplax sp. H2]|eukprot:XP_002110892.1 expressed hypothetical protein [Trichoplax adhaerens]